MLKKPRHFEEKLESCKRFWKETDPREKFHAGPRLLKPPRATVRHVRFRRTNWCPQLAAASVTAASANAALFVTASVTGEMSINRGRSSAAPGEYWTSAHHHRVPSHVGQGASRLALSRCLYFNGAAAIREVQLRLKLSLCTWSCTFEVRKLFEAVL